MGALASLSHLPTPNPLPEPETDLAVFSIDGQQVLVDLRDITAGFGEHAVVIGHEGKIIIMAGPLEKSDRSYHGARACAGPWVETRRNMAGGITHERAIVAVIGRVIDPGEKRRRFA